ncbi:MAG TPA: hypothetical protein VND21_05940 [Planctomycetota bacterium]|nr:hypothetical protein [Planctomycetota bacterium]
MTARRRALIVMPDGPVRSAVARILRGAGAVVTAASDPFEATARFAEAPADLVIAATAGWTRGDLRFLTALRARSPRATVVVLVPSERRRLAAAALEAGADAYLLDPVSLEEVAALARRALAGEVAGGPPDPGDLPTLAAEVSHATGNPLQVLSLLLEEEGSSSGEVGRARLRAEVVRLREVVEIVGGYGRLGVPRKSPTDLTALVEERMAALSTLGVVPPPRPRAMPPVDAPEADAAVATVDAAQVGIALDAMVRFLAARTTLGPGEPARPPRAKARERSSGHVEVAVRARGVHVDAAAWDEAVKSVVRLHDRTRAAHPGLAAARSVAEAHGGTLVRRETPRGTVVVLRLPRS